MGNWARDLSHVTSQHLCPCAAHSLSLTSHMTTSLVFFWTYLRILLSLLDGSLTLSFLSHGFPPFFSLKLFPWGEQALSSPRYLQLATFLQAERVQGWSVQHCTVNNRNDSLRSGRRMSPALNLLSVKLIYSFSPQISILDSHVPGFMQKAVASKTC